MSTPFSLNLLFKQLTSVD